MVDIIERIRRAIRAAFDECDRAITKRNARIQQLAQEWELRPVDIERMSGRNRETVRRALMTPEQLEAERARRRKPKEERP